MRSKALHRLPLFVSKGFQYRVGVMGLFTPLLSVVVVLDAPRVLGACFSVVVVEGAQRCDLAVDAHCRRSAAIVPAVVERTRSCVERERISLSAAVRGVLVLLAVFSPIRQ